MTSHRSTNVLLLIIALLLGVIALQLGSRPFVGEAVAQTRLQVTGMAGCTKTSGLNDDVCDEYRPLMVDRTGRLLVALAK